VWRFENLHSFDLALLARRSRTLSVVIVIRRTFIFHRYSKTSGRALVTVYQYDNSIAGYAGIALAPVNAPPPKVSFAGRVI
jgi:hypothetical protein